MTVYGVGISIWVEAPGNSQGQAMSKVVNLLNPLTEHLRLAIQGSKLAIERISLSGDTEIMPGARSSIRTYRTCLRLTAAVEANSPERAAASVREAMGCAHDYLRVALQDTGVRAKEIVIGEPYRRHLMSGNPGL